MTTLHVYAEGHIKNKAQTINKGDWIYLDGHLARDMWSLYFRYNKIDESKLNLTYVTHEEFFNLSMKFDVVVGNPPYQKSDNKRWKLWINFIIKSVELTKDGGHITMITPISWLNARENSSPEIFKATNIMKKLNLVNVEMIDSKVFNVGERIGRFTIEKSDPTPKSLIEWQRHKTVSDIIVEKVSGNNYNFVNYNSTLSDKNDNGNILCYHTSANRFLIDNVSALSDQTSGYKVIINRSGYYDVDVFDKGTIAGRNASAIMCKNRKEGEVIKQNLLSKLFKFVISNTKTSGFNSLKALPHINITNEWTDIKLYDHFGLTQEEIDFIESTTP